MNDHYEEICTFLNLYINKDENAGCYWEPNTRMLFRKSLKTSNKTYSNWKIERIIRVDKLLFYFVCLRTTTDIREKKIFCIGEVQGKYYIAYPVNYIKEIVDKSQMQNINVYKFRAYIDDDLFNRYGEAAIQQKLKIQERFLRKFNIDSDVECINIYWFMSNNVLKLIAKRSMFVEPTSGDIFIFLDQINDNYLSHEIIHNVFWNTLKKWPSLLLREGSAEAFFPQEYYANQKIDSRSIEFMIKNDNFDEAQGEKCAIHLGLFCRFLIEEYGVDKFIEAYTFDEYDSKTVLRKVYNMDYKFAIKRFEVWRTERQI